MPRFFPSQVTLGLVPAVVFGAAPARAQDEREINPGDPTAAATSLVVQPEYNAADDYTAPVLRVTYDKDWTGGTYSVNVEVPVGFLDFDDGAREYGLGDIRTRGFWKFYDSETSALANIVANLDVFLPTGDASRGLGVGTFVIVPGVILGFPVSPRFGIYTNPRINFSTGKTLSRSSAFPPGKNPTPGRESEEYLFAFQLETFFVYQSPEVGIWGFLDPIVDWDLLPEPGEDNYELTLRGQLGKMLGRVGLGGEGTVFVAGEKSQEFQVRLLVLYYF